MQSFILRFKTQKFRILRLNLKNLSRVLNLRRGSNMVGSTWNCIMCFEIWAGAQVEPVFDVSATRYKFFKFGLWSQFIQFIFIFIIGNEILERIGTDCTNKYFKFVGLKIDEFLNLDYQIEHVSNKIASSNFALNQIKIILPLNICLLVYNALVKL